MNKIKTILIVDDEQGYRDLLHRALSEQGYTVLVAAGGPEALDILKRDEVDIIITDMKMPKMDGLDVVIASRQLRPDIPIILMTGYAVEERVQEALARKASICLQKPFQMKELETALQSFLIT
ncbi:MAG: response regulator [Elusimicrobia bacterium]|nr:response regulator [Elusimicrobiota bacterium]